MILSTQTSYLGEKFGDKKAVRMIAQAGFDAVDLSLFGMKDASSPYLCDDWRERVAALVKEASDAGIFFNQAHAPFPVSKNDNAAFNELMFGRVSRAIEIAGMIGARCIVVHPMHHLPYAENRDRLKEENMAFYRALAPIARQNGVKIALENMWEISSERREILPSTCGKVADFVDYLDTLADDCFTACLDLGHCGLCGYDAADMIRALGRERLGALHVHDNNYASDLHTAPYLSTMHWSAICDALAEIGYTGDLTLEADTFFRGFPVSLSKDVLIFMHAIAAELSSRVSLA